MLARIPFWGWLMVIITALYLVYNPLGFSVWHMWTMGDPSQLLPFKLLATLLLTALLGLVLHGAMSTTSWVGVTVMVCLVMVGMWSVHTVVTFDLLNLHMWGWILQPMLGVILTVGWQWPKIWRRSTGAISVNDPDTPV